MLMRVKVVLLEQKLRVTSLNEVVVLLIKRFVLNYLNKLMQIYGLVNLTVTCLSVKHAISECTEKVVFLIPIGKDN